MKVLRLVKGSQTNEKKSAPREQRFRFGAEEVWEVSHGPTRRRSAPEMQTGPRQRRRAS
jgi:hypothetical protein